MALTPATTMTDSSTPFEWRVMPKLDLNRRWLTFALATGLAFDSRASGGDSVEVWVDLTEQAPTPGAAGSEAQRQRDRVAAQQDRVGEALFRLGAIELARLRANGNAIAVRIDRSRLDQVRAIAGVRRVRPARGLHPPRMGGATQG